MTNMQFLVESVSPKSIANNHLVLYILHSPEEVASGPRILCWVIFFHYLSLASLNGLVVRGPHGPRSDQNRHFSLIMLSAMTMINKNLAL